MYLRSVAKSALPACLYRSHAIVESMFPSDHRKAWVYEIQWGRPTRTVFKWKSHYLRRRLRSPRRLPVFVYRRACRVVDATAACVGSLEAPLEVPQPNLQDETLPQQTRIIVRTA